MTTPRDLDEPELSHFESFPPSAKLVYYVLAKEEPLTQGQLVTETRLSSRTVRHALTELDEAGFVTTELYIPDARKRLYRTATPSQIAEPNPQ